MLETLPRVSHEHHDALIPHIDALAAIADSIGIAAPGEVAERVAAEHRFLTTQLVPHMENAEASIYPQLERLMQNRHSMTPMRREHGEMRGLIRELGEMTSPTTKFGLQMRLRRLLYRMYAMIKVHLAEEEAYIGVLRRNLSADEAEELARHLEHAAADL